MKRIALGILLLGLLGFAGYAFSTTAFQGRSTTYTLGEIRGPPESPGAILHLDAPMVAALPDPARKGFETALQEGHAAFVLSPAQSREYHRLIARFADEQGVTGPPFFELEGRLFRQANLT